jgi:hypothetical protein
MKVLDTFRDFKRIWSKSQVDSAMALLGIELCNSSYVNATRWINKITKSVVWCPGQNKRIAPLTFFHGYRKVTKGLTAQYKNIRKIVNLTGDKPIGQTFTTRPLKKLSSIARWRLAKLPNLMVGHGPVPLCVIHKEGLCPSSGDINRLMKKPEIDCEQIAMDLPPVTSAVFLMAKSFCLSTIRRACAPAVGTSIGWWWYWNHVYTVVYLFYTIHTRRQWINSIDYFTINLLLCSSILCVVAYVSFWEGKGFYNRGIRHYKILLRDSSSLLQRCCHHTQMCLYLLWFMIVDVVCLAYFL